MKRLLPLLAALPIALGMTPAEALCQGCGGAVAMLGFADVGTIDSGSDPLHVLSAGCNYKSVVNYGGEYGTPTTQGVLTVTGTATRPEENPNVYVRCALTLVDGQTHVVDAHGVHAEGIATLPAQAEVRRICLDGEARWPEPWGWDTATISFCVEGASVNVNSGGIG
jgi:hypothetical protein